MSGLGEFSLIKRYFHKLGSQRAEIKLGVGDDCAVVTLSSDQELCLSMDTMVSGIHFPNEAAGDVVANRALSAAVSDLAAMGAQPSHFTLSLTLPEVDEGWLEAFSAALSDRAGKYGISLVGGDTTKGPLTVGMQVHGFVPKGRALLRSGANVGDLVVVTGSLGDAGAGLRLYGSGPNNLGEEFLLQRYCAPSARIHEGLVLRKYASACIDISDGLLADLSHLVEASGVSARVNREAVPLSPQLENFAGEKSFDYALYSGDDYELAASIPEAFWMNEMTQSERELFTVIGCIEERFDGQSLRLFDSGEFVDITQKGYQHFD